MQAECKEMIVTACVECVIPLTIGLVIGYFVGQLLSWLLLRFIERKSKV